MNKYLRFLLGLVVSGAVVLPAATASAQISRVGATFQAIGSAVRGSGVAYDPVNRVYLTIAANGTVFGRFVTEDGAAVGSTHFRIQASSVFGHFPGVAYSPDADGGAGAFLVVWHESDLTNWRTSIHARMVSVGRGGAFGPDLQIAPAASFPEASVKVDYSRGAGKFLVVWGTDAGVPNVNGVTVTNSLAYSPIFSIAASGDGELKPGVACHTTAPQCLVSYAGWGGVGAFARSVIVDMNAGAAQENTRATLQVTAGTYQTDAVYNAGTNEYLVLWYEDPAQAIYGRRVAAGSGAPASSVIPISTYFAARDSVDAAYNPVSGTSFLIAMGKNTYENGGVEINGGGSPGSPIEITATGNKAPGNFYPTVGADVSRGDWLVATSVGLGSLYAQRVTTGSAGSTPPPSSPPPPPPPQSPPPATGSAAAERARSDFNGDGKYDILWQNTSDGYIASWTLNGTSLLSSDLVSHRITDNNWRIAGTGDFNGDGKPDIVWQHKTEGWVGVWYMNGLTLIDSVYFSINRVLDPQWRIVGVGDFDGDGKPDLLWQHETDRWLAAWLLNGVTLKADGSVLLSPNKVYDARWKIAGVGDFNRDGKSDIVWRHADTGDMGIWLMNGLSLVNSISFNPGTLADSNWQIAGIIDANMDGKPDLLWHHVTQGWVGVWLMNGNDLIDSVNLGPGRVADVNWKVRGPK